MYENTEALSNSVNAIEEEDEFQSYDEMEENDV